MHKKKQFFCALCAFLRLKFRVFRVFRGTHPCLVFVFLVFSAVKVG